MLRAGADCEGFPREGERPENCPLLSPRKQTEPQVAGVVFSYSFLEHTAWSSWLDFQVYIICLIYSTKTNALLINLSRYGIDIRSFK